MLNVLRYSFLLAAAGGLLGFPALSAAEALPGNLVTAQWLADHRTNPEVLILDASPAQAYAAKHIPGALSVDVYAWYGREARPADTEKLFREWGVSSGKTIVVYDQGGSMLATRVFFSLDSNGFTAANLFVLDGGLFQWEKNGFPLTAERPPAPKPGSFTISAENVEPKVALPEFLAASGDPVRNALVEGLGADWHYGRVLALSKAGHIPHGILLPSADFYHADRTFKSEEEIRKMAEYLGVRPDQQIYTYCGGGVAASVPWFALKYIAHYPSVKLYTGSEFEWLADERDLPYWTYDAPFLMRDSSWLQFAAGAMPRAMGLVHVSIVDVRPPADYAQGHVPFAVNVPAEVFRNHLGYPEKLAETLSAAGVAGSDEAVVVSGAGLTKDAALAFAMLQQSRQKKVSIFADSMAQWTQLGFALSQEAAAKPAVYPTGVGKAVIIRDARSTHGVYAKVFLASGQNMPAEPPDGKVVHLPSADLVNADGTPKPAKAIWEILTKAGVPRYAELICFSENPAEAAVNYFVLKLMGYPDVKVWLR